MLANNLTDKLTGLLRYEITSITIINGSKTIGTPLGTKSFKYPSPCFIKPIIVTPIKINEVADYIKKNALYNFSTTFGIPSTKAVKGSASQIR